MTVKPGLNRFSLDHVAGGKGVYTLGQMSLQLKQLNLLENLPLPASSFAVTTEQPVILLNKGEGELFAGIENKVRIRPKPRISFLFLP